MAIESKRVVYVKNGSRYELRELKILAENESRAVVEGVTSGTEVAMVDPTAPRKSANSNSSSTAGTGGGQP
jgi:hypothetical protein